MKHKLINFSISTLIVFILGTLLTFVFSLLASLNVYSMNVNDNIMIGVSMLLFFLFGFIFGIKEKRRGILNGIFLSILYLGFLFLFKSINPDYQYSNWYIIASRCSLIILGSIIGVNVNRG